MSAGSSTLIIAVPLHVEHDFVVRAIDRAASGAVVVVVGAGRGSAARLEAALSAGPADAVLITGFAGGLDPLLRPGDLVVARRILREDDGVPVMPDEGLLGRAGRALRAARLPFVGEALLTAEGPLLTVEAKGRAFLATGAAAVDLESYWLAQTARDHRVPVVVVRVVLDAAGDRVPGYLPGLAEVARREQANALGRGLLRHPRDVAAVVRLARSTVRAGARLQRFLEVFLADSE